MKMHLLVSLMVKSLIVIGVDSLDLAKNVREEKDYGKKKNLKRVLLTYGLQMLCV